MSNFKKISYHPHPAPLPAREREKVRVGFDKTFYTMLLIPNNKGL
jgi:hypothetical protein